MTVKSDDVEARTKIYESMVKGENTLEAGTPISFDVLTNENPRPRPLNMCSLKRSGFDGGKRTDTAPKRTVGPRKQGRETELAAT